MTEKEERIKKIKPIYLKMGVMNELTEVVLNFGRTLEKKGLELSSTSTLKDLASIKDYIDMVYNGTNKRFEDAFLLLEEIKNEGK